MLLPVVITKARKEKSLSVEDSDLNSVLTDVLTNVSKWKVNSIASIFYYRYKLINFKISKQVLQCDS